MKYLVLLLSLFIGSTTLVAQTKPYVIYNAKGKKVKYKKMMKKLAANDIILFGEYHNNPISHWLQYEVTADLHQSKKLILGAEMIEADNQTALSDYVASRITFEALDTLARLWPNHKTDYAPLVDFARENGLPFIATNVPRRYARMVNRNGGFGALDDLPANEKAWIAPLPIAFDIELPTYQSILEMMGDHASEDLVKAQALKDATMAHFILQHYKAGHTFIHYNGAFHSDFYEGILWYLKQQRTDLSYGTISTVSQANVNKLQTENLGKADFIICVDEDMTTTY